MELLRARRGRHGDWVRTSDFLAQRTRSRCDNGNQTDRFRRARGESTLSSVNRTGPRRRAEHAIHHESDALF